PPCAPEPPAGRLGREGRRSRLSLAILQVHDDWNVVGGPLTLALVPLDAHPRGARRGCRRRVDEVDAHALIAWKAQLLVIPEGVGVGLGDESARELLVAGLCQSVECVAGR